MRQIFAWATLALAAGITLGTWVENSAYGEHHRTSRGNDLFYNYYVPGGPGYCGVPAQLYTAPLPVPAFVGHTYYTYQPLMPHEFLYKHHRSYYRHNPGGGWVQTKVSWGHTLFGHHNHHHH